MFWFGLFQAKTKEEQAQLEKQREELEARSAQVQAKTQEYTQLVKTIKVSFKVNCLFAPCFLCVSFINVSRGFAVASNAQSSNYLCERLSEEERQQKEWVEAELKTQELIKDFISQIANCNKEIEVRLFSSGYDCEETWNCACDMCFSYSVIPYTLETCLMLRRRDLFLCAGVQQAPARDRVRDDERAHKCKQYRLEHPSARGGEEASRGRAQFQESGSARNCFRVHSVGTAVSSPPHSLLSFLLAFFSFFLNRRPNVHRNQII